MNAAIAMLYGLIQGLTEFLPVSSSAHLALLPRLMQFRDPGVVFDLGMHLGTAFSVMYVFRDECLRLFKFTISCLKSKNIDPHQEPLLSNMLVATGVTFVLALIFKSFALTYGRNPLLMAGLLVIFGFLMWLADSKGKTDQSSAVFSLKASFLVGAAQTMALFPGVSRSGVTMTALRALGYSRKDSASFSFFLSIPLIVGGMVLEGRHLIGAEIAFDYQALVIGFFVSFVVGLLAIKFFIALVDKIGLLPFFIYRLVLGIVLFILFT